MFRLIPYRKPNTMIRSEDIFNRFFDDFFTDEFFAPIAPLDTKMSGFKVDVKDLGDAYLLEADLPGFDKDNVQITYENQHLTIQARRETEEESKGEQFIRRERYCGEIKRSFFIDNITPDGIDALFKNGILTIKLKKLPIQNEAKQIEIK